MEFIKGLIDDYMQAKYIALLIAVAVISFMMGTMFPGQLSEKELMVQLNNLHAEQAEQAPQAGKDPFFAKAKGKW